MEVEDDDHLLHLSRYIHLNPLDKHNYKGPSFAGLQGYDFSSYQDYIGLRNTDWIKKDLVLSIFEDTGMNASDKYKYFVESQAENTLEGMALTIGDLALE
jgi:hypothetical protein